MYKETQPFRQNPAVWLIAPAAVLIWALAFAQLVLGMQVGTRPLSGLGMFILWLGVGVALPAFFLLASLRVNVDRDAVRLAFWPFARRTISRADIVSAFIRSSDPIGEYGGWGWRLALGNRRAYSVSGRQGVQLELKGGQQVFIGSQSPAELLMAIV